MAEYIAREVLLAQLRAMESYNVSPMYRRGYDDCVEAILKAPAADVVPVVRCKDCKWFVDNNGGEWMQNVPSRSDYARGRTEAGRFLQLRRENGRRCRQ